MKRSFVVEIDGKRHAVEVLDSRDEIISFNINGKRVEAKIFSKIPDIPKKFEFFVTQTLVRSPFVGVISKVYVNPGQPIKKGDSLMSIEAMKMENIVTVKFDAKVVKVFKSEGDRVSKDELLLELEPFN